LPTVIHLQLLQTPSLHLPGGVVLPLPPNDAALLAVLAIDGATSRESMAELVWPDAAGEGPRMNLRQRLTRFKSRAGLTLDAGGQRLALPLSATGLAPAPAPGPEHLTLTHDLQDLTTRLAADPQAAGGELLGDFNYDANPRLAQWVQRARERWHAQRRDALAGLAEQLEREQRIAQALPYAARLVQDDPLAEHAHRRVMRLHYLRGDRGAALAAYDRLRTLLRESLGTIPSRDTLELGRLIEAGAASPAAVAPPPLAVSLRRPPHLMGREAPSREVQEAWLQPGAVVVVTGEAGIGKTRFAQALADTLGIALRVQALRGDDRVPYALLARMLRAARPPAADLPAWARGELARVAPEWGEAPAGPLLPLRLAQAARLALHGHAGLLLDDLHAADAATLELLPLLASEPMRCLLAARSGELPHSLAEWMRSGGAVREIELGPLDEAAVQALLGSLALPEVEAQRWTGVLMQHTGGHPLFLLETLRELLRGGVPAAGALRLPLPSEVGRLIERRFDRLSAPALKLLRMAALAGQDASVGLAAQVLGVDPLALTEPWAELEAAHMFSEAGFAHDIVQEAALRSVPRAIARALHALIAAALEQSEAAAGRIATHWLAAGEWAAATRHLEAAALAAQRAGRRGEELALLDEAARCHDRAGHESSAFRLRATAVEASIASEPLTRAAERADALAQAARSDEQQLSALLAQAKCALTSGDQARGLPWAQQALELAQRVGDAGRRLQAAGLYAAGLVRSGEAAAGMSVFADHAPAAEAHADVEVRTEYLGMYALGLHATGRFAEAARLFTDTADVAEALGDLNTAMLQRMNAATCEMALGRVDAAVHSGEAALRHWQRQGEPEGIPAAATHMTVGLLLLTAGRYRDAIVRLEWALARFRSGGEIVWVTATENHLAHAFLRLGQTARAHQAMTLPASELTHSPTRGRRIVMHALIALQGGGPVAPALREALAALPSDVSALDRLASTLVLAQTRPADEAVVLARRVFDEAREAHPAIALHAQVREAEWLWRLGHLQDAATPLRAAVAQGPGRLHRDMAPTEFWWLACNIFDAAGASAEAHDCLREAVAQIERERPHVPEPFVDSFLNRHPVHRDVLARARQSGWGNRPG